MPTNPSRVARWTVEFSTTHRWKTILLSVIGVAAMASGLEHLAPSVSYEDMLGPTLPQLQDYKAIQDEFTRDDNLQVPGPLIKLHDASHVLPPSSRSP